MKTKHLILLVILTLLSANVSAQRIKDAVSISGVRSNQLVGYGLVVGLPGTGEQQSVAMQQSFRAMLENFGITLPAGINPNVTNVAAVTVHAELPAFAKPGQKIDITVSSIGQS